jgi:hypothetical protein
MEHRSWVRRLERQSVGGMLNIPQPDGSVARFPESEGLAAFGNLVSRMGAGDAAPPEHPMLTAARNSTDPEWREMFFGGLGDGDITEPIEDLSE